MATGPRVVQPDLGPYRRFKRQMYVASAAVGVVVMVLSWVLREDDDILLTYGYPIFAVLLTFAALAMWLERLTLAYFERGLLTALSILVFARLIVLLHLSTGPAERLLTLVGGHYWSIAILILAAYVMLGWRIGLRFSLAVMAASALLTATAIPGPVTEAHGVSTAVAYVTRIHAFLLLFITLTSVVAVLQEHLAAATAWAQRLEVLAGTDALTGLANRRTARSSLQRALASADRDGRPVSVITVDLDRFKAINDAHGHDRGDEVLCAIAELLEEHAREADCVARWGGEEFLLVVDADREGAARLAERCRDAIATARPAGLAVTASFGVEQRTPDDGPEDLLRRADQLLYDAKDRGGNHVHQGSHVQGSPEEDGLAGLTSAARDRTHQP